MEGLPPTSNTKMIDMWLILCQLVPFAQVVLLTAMEYLREEEEKVETDVSEQKEDSQVVIGKGNKLDTINVEFNEVDDYESKPQEAWAPNNTEPDRIDIIQKLLTIGK